MGIEPDGPRSGTNGYHKASGLTSIGAARPHPERFHQRELDGFDGGSSVTTTAELVNHEADFAWGRVSSRYATGWMPEFRSRISVVPRTIYIWRESGYPGLAAPPVPSVPRSRVGHAYVSARPSSSGATGRRPGAVGRCQTGVGPVQKSNPSDPTFSDSKLGADRTSPSSTVS